MATPNVKTNNNYFERTETLVKYYHDVSEYSVVDADREKELFTLLNEGKKNYENAKKKLDREMMRKYKAEVEKLRAFIINSNLRFVISIARIYASNNNILDLINEGNIGLIEAVDTFDVALGNRFQTHAVYLIRRYINLYRQNDDLLIRKNNESKTYHVMSNMTNKFIQENGREPTSEELKDYINEHYPNAKIKDSADVLTLRYASIDEGIDSDETDSNAANMNLFNTYSATHNDYEDVTNIEHMANIVNTLMRGLSDRDKTIIKMHFGIGQLHNSPASIAEISDKVDLTPERVRQLITEIKDKLKSEYGHKLNLL